MIVLDRPVILGCIGPCHGQSMIHALAGRSPGIIIAVWAEVVECREAAILTGAIDGTKYRTQLKTLQRGQFCIHIAAERATLILIVGIGHHVSVGVAIVHVPVAIIGSIIRTAVESVVVAGLSTCISLTAVEYIGGIYRSQWRCAECTTQGVVILIAHAYAHALGVNEAYLLAHLQQFVYHVVLRVHTEVVALVVRYVLTAHDTFLTHISHRQRIGRNLVTAGNTQIVTLHLGVILKHLVYPVGIVEIAVGVVDALHLCEVVRLVAGVDLLLVHNGHILL